jgi:hypothetical protein
MRFKVGNKIQFTGYFEPGVTDTGRVGRHHYKKSRRLVVRGVAHWYNTPYECYLSEIIRGSTKVSRA